MKTIKHVVAMLLVASLCMPLTRAQPSSDKRQEAQTTNKIAQDVLIIIQQEQVRFTAQKAVEEMRLQIFDPAGQLVYDSGAVSGLELTWSLQQANGETIKSGLYAYTFSLKEAGAETARTRRGHFIVDRARERDGQTDRLWITSQNDSGVGAELTVARNDGATIAGTSVAAGGKEREGQAPEQTTSNLQNAIAAEAVTGAGTPGRIARFTSAQEIGNSELIQIDGKIGIGTTNPGNNKLAVATPTDSYGISHTDGTATLSTFVGPGNTGIPNGAWIGTVSNHDLRFFTADGPPRLTITKSGDVGIGTTTPGKNKLAVAALTNSYGISHTDGIATLSTYVGPGSSEVTNGGWIGTVSNHDLRFFTADGPARLTINTAGNVGIGTSAPSAKLDVNGDLKVQGVSFQALVALVQQLQQQVASLPHTSPPSGRNITVSRQGAGSSTVFSVNGSGFTPNALAVIKITEAGLHFQVQFAQTVQQDGRFATSRSLPCVSGTSFTVTAFEDANPTGTFANAVVTTCP